MNSLNKKGLFPGSAATAGAAPALALTIKAKEKEDSIAKSAPETISTLERTCLNLPERVLLVLIYKNSYQFHTKYI